MITLIFTAVIAFLITFGTIPTLIKFAKQVNLFTAINERTSHNSAEIPSLGGVGIFLGMMLAILIMCPPNSFSSLQYLLATQFMIFLLGLKDDIFVLRARTKLMVQVICVCFLIFLSDVRVESFYGVFGIEGLSHHESILFTIFLYVGLINAFNLIDGVNCNAGLISISATSFLAYWFAKNNFMSEAVVSFAVIGAILSFLYYNRTPAKIFMGDTGSLLLGLTITYLIIKFIQLNHTEAHTYRSAPSIAVALLFVPIIDTLQVMFIRLKNRKNPFRPDRNHLHHILLDAGFSHHKTSLTLFIINTLSIVGAVAFNHYTGKVVIPLVFLLGYGVINGLAFGFFRNKRFCFE